MEAVQLFFFQSAKLENKMKIRQSTKKPHKARFAQVLARYKCPQSQWVKYTAQLSDKVEGRVSKMLSQEISRTESRILGALSKVEKFLQNSLVRVQSGTAPGTLWKFDKEKRELTEDRSQNDPRTDRDTSVDSSPLSLNSHSETVLQNRVVNKRLWCKNQIGIQ